MWLFNANNYGNLQLQERILNPDLPREFYTRAGVVRPVVKIKFDPVLVWVFAALEGLALVVLWGSLVWLFVPWDTRGGREMGIGGTAFPVVDLLFRAEGKVGEREREELSVATGKEVLGRFGRTRVCRIR